MKQATPRAQFGLPNDEQLLKRIDEFLDRTKMAPTRFGIEALGEGGLLKSLRAGRSPSLKNAEKIVRFMADYQPQEERAA